MKQDFDFYFDCILGFFIMYPDLINEFKKELKKMKVVGTVEFDGKACVKRKRLCFPVSFYGADFVMAMMQKTIKQFERDSGIYSIDVLEDFLIDIDVENVTPFLVELFKHCNFEEFFCEIDEKTISKFIRYFYKWHSHQVLEQFINDVYKKSSSNYAFCESIAYPLSKLGVFQLKEMKKRVDFYITYREDEEAHRLNIQQKKEAYEATKKGVKKNEY